MKRLMLALALMVTGVALPVTSAEADDTSEKRWYGWISYVTKSHAGGFDEEGNYHQPSEVDEYTRVRVKGTSARIVQVTGGSFSKTPIGFGNCVKTTTWTNLGPGTTPPGLFDNSYYFDLDQSNTYVLSLTSMLKRVARTESASPAGCTTVSNQTYDSYESHEIDCAGPFQNGRCKTDNKHRLKGSSIHTTPITLGSIYDEARWNLVDDPDKDPCRDIVDRCLDNSNLKVDVLKSGARGDLGVVCGKAAFKWRAVTGVPRTVKKREKACVFLVGNESARLVLDVARAEGVPIGTAFAGTLFKPKVAEFTGGVSVWGKQQRSKKAVLRSLANSLVTVTNRVNAITTAGRAVGLQAVPIAGAFIVNQIENNDACLQVIVDNDGGKQKTDWSMVYAHSTDSKLTKSKVYRKIDRRLKLDKIEPVNLNMRCTTSGRVAVSEKKSDAMTSRVPTLFDIR